MKQTNISIAITGEKHKRFVTLSGYLFEHAELLLCVHRAYGVSNRWSVSEVSTGFSVCQQLATRAIAVSEAKWILDNRTPGDIERALARASADIAELIFGRPAQKQPSKKAIAHKKPASIVDISAVIHAVQMDEQTGFCLACGAEQSGVEPDAREYECEACGAFKVFGAEQILLENVA